MAFPTGYIDSIQKSGAGERYGANTLIISMDNFADGLKVGRFAKYDSGNIANMNGGADPVIAGVVLRDVANAVEQGDILSAPYYSHVDLARIGLVSVGVKAGETPAFQGIVYASNAGDQNDGLAVASATGAIATNARFVAEIKSGVWLVEMAGQTPQTVTNQTSYVPASYTVATVPAAGSNSGVVVYVSDGAAGKQVLAISNGTSWIKLDGTGAVIAAS